MGDGPQLGVAVVAEHGEGPLDRLCDESGPTAHSEVRAKAMRARASSWSVVEPAGRGHRLGRDAIEASKWFSR